MGLKKENKSQKHNKTSLQQQNKSPEF